jgi:hypothetical protein
MPDNQKRWFCDIKFEGDVQFSKLPTGITASAIAVSTTSFNNILNSSDDTMQKVADKLDDHTHSYTIPYYRVGDVIESTSSVNPGESVANGGYGYGTWALYGPGKQTMCIDSGDAQFDSISDTGGNKTKDISHTHPIGRLTQANSGGSGVYGAPANTSSGGSTTLDVLDPYVMVYRWQRTA